MTKRELISREEVLSHPFANGKYDRKNADINFILGHESYKEWLETLPVFTEQDIVKPYLEKLKADIEVAYDELDGYDPDSLGAFASRIDDLIDNLLSESEGKE